MATAAILLLSVSAAVAHDGVDHSSEPGAEAALDWSNYEKVTLTKDVGEPIDMAVMPDGAVLHTARNGDVRHTDPDTGITRIVNTIDVYANSEDGLQTIALAPDFDESGWVYLYYSPRVMEAPYPRTSPVGSAPNQLPEGEDTSYWDQWKGYNQLSRVRWDAAAGALDLATEQAILQVEVQRGQCCHVGGDIAFDSQGNVYLSTGDNTPASVPGADGYAPMNDAPGMNPGFDARRSSGSTNDLRGKIVRIFVEEDGSYTIPEGNLFSESTAGTRPEIYVMGVRNPFRIAVDPTTDALMWGDHGPSAAQASERGPIGYVEWQSTGSAINSGWPYCHGPNASYNDYDYELDALGAPLDCDAGAHNGSRWNTGLETVPPATRPQLYYGSTADDQPWPELTELTPEGGQAPVGGPVYRYDESSPDTAFPPYWDGKAFFGEFAQDYLAAFTIQEPDGPVTHIEHVLPNTALNDNLQPITDGPMDIEFGPDGSLYILDYGNGFFRQNPEAGLYRVDYAPGNKSPVAVIAADPISSSEAPLTVTLDGSGSSDPEGGELTYEWDTDGDGEFDTTGQRVTRTYTQLGQYTARLRVTDPEGRTALTSRSITVGNVAPDLHADAPANGGFFGWGDAVPYSFTTSDAEDGDRTVCSNLTWTFGLGHDAHAHPEELGGGCRGAWATPADAPEHGEAEKLYGVVVASYLDGGNGDIPPAQAETSLILNPFVQEAEHADTTEGVEIVSDETAGGLSRVTSLGAGDHLSWDPVNFTGIDGAEIRGAGHGTIELRWGTPDAEPFATADIASDGWSTVPADVTSFPTGTGELFVTSTGGVDLDTIEFLGAGVTDVTAPEVGHSLDPAEPTGANGWYTEAVSLGIVFTDDGTMANAEYSLDGGLSWTNFVYYPQYDVLRPATISGDAAHEVLYRATDTGANVSETGSTTVRIDATAPRLTLTGIAEGTEVRSSGTLALGAEANDTMSGVTASTLALDGETLEPGDLELWSIELGSHELVATATDEAGHTAEAVVSFTVTTSLRDLGLHLARLVEDGDMTKADSGRLDGFLRQAERHAVAGRDAQQAAALQRFADAAHATGADVLVRDAQALVGNLS
jgi:glucose/arabinose dehydrogenase